MSDIRQFSPLWGTWEIPRKLGEGSFGAVWHTEPHPSPAAPETMRLPAPAGIVPHFHPGKVAAAPPSACDIAEFPPHREG